jgi:gamma-glutamylcysteine synthetase
MMIDRRASKAACRTAPKKEAPSIKTEKRFALSMRQTLALGERIGIARYGTPADGPS